MSSAKRQRKRDYTNGKSTPPQARDELGTWPYSKLVRMDRRFVERMERAIERGLERLPEDPARAA